jgi:hypothetical protein
MATKTIMKLTEGVAIVKISGAGSATISLATDLLSSTQVVSGTPAVGIGQIQWSLRGTADITRNAVAVMELQNDSGWFDLNGNGGMLDTTEGTSDIVVNITTGGTVFLTLRKVTGYASKIEPYKFGSYDDPTQVGQ